jgi:hypothetical protein
VVETLKGLGKFITDYEGLLTSLRRSTDQVDVLFPPGKSPFIVLGFDGPEILHVPRHHARFKESFLYFPPLLPRLWTMASGNPKCALSLLIN